MRPVFVTLLNRLYFYTHYKEIMNMFECPKYGFVSIDFDCEGCTFCVKGKRTNLK